MPGTERTLKWSLLREGQQGTQAGRALHGAGPHDEDVIAGHWEPGESPKQLTVDTVPLSLCEPGPVASPLWAWACLSITVTIATTPIIIIAEFYNIRNQCPCPSTCPHHL